MLVKEPKDSIKLHYLQVMMTQSTQPCSMRMNRTSVVKTETIEAKPNQNQSPKVGLIEGHKKKRMVVIWEVEKETSATRKGKRAMNFKLTKILMKRKKWTEEDKREIGKLLKIPLRKKRLNSQREITPRNSKGMKIMSSWMHRTQR